LVSLRVALVLVVIYFIYYVYRAYDLRETHIYIINTALENNNYLTTNTVYIL
jgi:uncharacterized membrane protein YukC